MKGLQALFNQDNGTGRVVRMGGGGLPNAAEHIAQWLNVIPTELKTQVNVNGPGFPAGGGSDDFSFACSGAPAFGLGALSWGYGNYAWHTNRDTYDKIVFRRPQVERDADGDAGLPGERGSVADHARARRSRRRRRRPRRPGASARRRSPPVPRPADLARVREGAPDDGAALEVRGSRIADRGDDAIRNPRYTYRAIRSTLWR